MTSDQLAATLADIHQRQRGLEGRIEEVSALFLGVPYRLGPLGEGPDGEYDREPLYSFKEADCTTYVEEVMALSVEGDLGRALKTLQKIRYKGGRVSYETRNHFPETDWIPNNVKAGFLEDVTRQVAGDKAKTVTKLVSKKAWYAAKTLDDIQGFDNAPPGEKENRLERLKKAGDRFPDETAELPILPMDALPAALPRIPSGTVANLVREDKPDKPVVVTHQVLILQKGGQTVVRHAASGAKVSELPALEYFYRYFNSSWRLMGLNLNRIR